MRAIASQLVFPARSVCTGHSRPSAPERSSTTRCATEASNAMHCCGSREGELRTKTVSTHCGSKCSSCPNYREEIRKQAILSALTRQIKTRCSLIKFSSRQEELLIGWCRMESNSFCWPAECWKYSWKDTGFFHYCTEVVANQSPKAHSPQAIERSDHDGDRRHRASCREEQQTAIETTLYCQWRLSTNKATQNTADWYARNLLTWKWLDNSIDVKVSWHCSSLSWRFQLSENFNL